MRYRFVFVVGLGVGFVLGARAGRERYEQLVKLTRKAKDSPAVQQAAGAVQAQAAGIAKTAKGKVSERVPKLTESARSKAGAARSKVESTLHDHGVGAKNSQGGTASDGQHTSAPDAPGGSSG
jgi:uncharacterized protein YjbJ (UPF0337 family)